MSKMQQVQDFVSKTAGQVFSVTFEKADGTLREMNCKLRINKALAGGASTCNYEGGQIPVVDVQLWNALTPEERETKKAYKTWRSFYADKVVSLRMAGMEVSFK